MSALVNVLIRRFQIEKERFDRSGIYAYTQRSMAYNSNKIEGSTLNEEQTASLFDTGILPKTDQYYRAKDVEETNGHFLMFQKMLDTLDQQLSEDLIKTFHYELKSGVFEDRANGYAIGAYKTRPNMVGTYRTTLPQDVPRQMEALLSWYHHLPAVSLRDLAEFHARYECIHPFQDGNGRTGRLILFRECLKQGLTPVIVLDQDRPAYLEALREYRNGNGIEALEQMLSKEQEMYRRQCEYFLGPDQTLEEETRETWDL